MQALVLHRASGVCGLQDRELGAERSGGGL
jgi:hypothetical protein